MIAGLQDDLVALISQAPSAVSTIVSILKRINPVLPTVKTVVDDPAFIQVIDRIRILHEIEASKPSNPSTPGQGPSSAGIGLDKAVPVLDAVIYARRNPWAPWVFGAGLLLLIGGVGYRLGRSKA